MWPGFVPIFAAAAKTEKSEAKAKKHEQSEEEENEQERMDVEAAESVIAEIPVDVLFVPVGDGPTVAVPSVLTTAVITIGATIRVSLLAREQEISIMRLVGATDAFVRAPFLIDGFIKGVLGGLLALLLIWVAYRVIDTRFIKLVFFDERLVFAGLAAGALIGIAGSATSVWRHLRHI